MAGNAVEFIVCGHHCGHVRFFYGHLERRKMNLAHLALAHVHGRSVQAAERLSPAYKMLGTGHDLPFRIIAVAALKPPDTVFAHLGNQPGIFAEGLPHPAPAGIACDIEIRRETPRHPGHAHFLSSLRTYLFHYLGMEGGGKVDIARIHGAAGAEAVPVYGIDAEKKRDSQPGLACEYLQLVRLLSGQHVHERTDLAVADAVREVGIAQILIGSINVLIRRTLIRRHIARTYILAHLAYLLLESHLLEKQFRALFSAQRSIVPVARRTGACKHDTGYQEISFHYNWIFRFALSRIPVLTAGTLRVLSSQVQSLVLAPFTSTFLGLDVQRTSKL